MATRRERVLIEVEDHFTSEVARMAASAALLKRELNSLSGTSVTTARDADRMRTSLRGVGDEIDSTGKKVRSADSDLNQFTGRLGVLVRSIAAIGPAIIPIGGAAVPAIAAMTAGLGAAAGAAGVALVAFKGLGDAMKAMDAYQLEPTRENFQKLREEMDKIGPTGAEMVRFLDSLEPQLKSIQEAARQGLFPGVEQGIEALLTQLPQMRRIVFDIADALGDVAADTGRGLTGDGFRAFFDYLETDAAPTLKAFAAATGNVAEGIANLLVGFAPLTRDFTGGMVAATQAFADWSATISQTDGFQNFLDYLRETGPKVAELIGQIALSLAAIVEAAAPVGSALLPVLTSLARVIESIANSDIGTPLFTAVAAMSALRLATSAWGKIATTTGAQFVATNAKATASILTVTSAQDRARMSASQLAAAERARTTSALAGAGKMAAVFGGLALASSGATDSIGMTNTASLALMGTMLGPWGTAIGGAAGLTMDLAAANDGLEAAIRGADDAIQSMNVEQLTAALAELDAQLASANEKAANYHPFSTNIADPLETAQNNFRGFMSGLNELITGTGKAAEAKDKETVAALRSAEANARWAEHARIAGRNAGYSASEIRGMTSAMEENRSAAIGAFDAVTHYAQALADARKHAKGAAGGINATTKEGRENRDVLSNLAASWNNQSKAVTNNVAKWREARTAFIQTAVAMGVPIQKARDLADRLMEIPKQRVIDIEMRGGDESIAAMKRIKAQAESVAGEYRVSFIVTQTNAFNKRAATPAYDSGGYTGRGGKYEPAGIVHRDEVVLPREVVRRDRAMLKSRYGFLPGMDSLPGYAGGGVVGASSQGIGTAISLSADAAAQSLSALADLGVKELHTREKLLEKELDRDKRREDALRSQIDSLRSAVAGRFESELFGDSDFGADSGLSAAALARHQSGSAVSSLRSDIASARALRQALRQARQAGIRGSALAELAQSADASQIQALLASGMAGQFNRLYGVRNEVAANTGRYASQVTGLDRRLVAAVEARKEDTRLLRAVERRLAAIEKNTKDAPEKTAKGVGREVNGANVAGNRGRTP